MAVYIFKKLCLNSMFVLLATLKSIKMTTDKNLYSFLCIFGQMLSKHLTVEEVMSYITDVQNSLNINFTGIHAFEYLFSVKLYEK